MSGARNKEGAYLEDLPHARKLDIDPYSPGRGVLDTIMSEVHRNLNRPPSRTNAANAARHAKMLACVERARELHDSGLKPSQIAVRMSRELGYAEDDPLRERQVQRWLAYEKGDTTT